MSSRSAPCHCSASTTASKGPARATPSRSLSRLPCAPLRARAAFIARGGARISAVLRALRSRAVGSFAPLVLACSGMAQYVGTARAAPSLRSCRLGRSCLRARPWRLPRACRPAAGGGSMPPPPQRCRSAAPPLPLRSARVAAGRRAGCGEFKSFFAGENRPAACKASTDDVGALLESATVVYVGKAVVGCDIPHAVNVGNHENSLLKKKLAGNLRVYFSAWIRRTSAQNLIYRGWVRLALSVLSQRKLSTFSPMPYCKQTCAM